MYDIQLKSVDEEGDDGHELFCHFALTHRHAEKWSVENQL